eukprot:TRINITY_DN1520_c0_g1_i2.p1 TRINITY_DN1520_c0_g1~~TRINITY_DN1520_c0_g1_i2.p1  ORF type:complete len:149 (-),score=19.26 TRINITY_DN1520_c0_g1_i2:144-590(-)
MYSYNVHDIFSALSRNPNHHFCSPAHITGLFAAVSHQAHPKSCQLTVSLLERLGVVILIQVRCSGAFCLSTMPASKKDMRKKEQAAKAKAGIVTDDKKLRKSAEVNVACKVCCREFRVTKRNVELLTHQTSKHPASTFEACFPGQTHE